MRWLWLVVGACAALALGGCGGSDTDSASSPSSTTQASVPQRSQQSSAGQGREQTKAKQPEGSATTGGGKDSTSSQQNATTVKVPPISSAPIAGSKAPAPGVATVKDGDNSVQTYGTEADETERTQAAIALQAYLNARRQEDWGAACAYLAQRPKQELEKVTQGASGQGKDLDSCAGVMAALSKGTPQSQLGQEATITEVLSFRGGGDIPGDPSYLIFTGPPAQTLYSMPMYLEAGGWKVGLAQPAELPV